MGDIQPPCDLDGKRVDRAVAEQAVQWWIELQDGEASGERRAAWQRWRVADPAHELAWQRIESVSGQLAGIPPDLARAALDAPGRRKRRSMRMLVALAMGGGVAGAAWHAQRWRALRADLASATGEIRTLALPDGGRVVLDTASAVNVRYGANRRVLQLVRGAVLVRTAPDAKGRPFLVETRDGSARALGTRFTVRQFDEAVGVAVLDGAVELRPADAPTDALVLRAYQQGSFTRHTVRPAVPLEAGAGAWADGMLVASRMRLDEFLAELARYRPGHIGCDPAVAHLRVAGAYPLADTDRVLAALTSALPLELHFFTRYWVEVRARAGKK